MWNFLNIWDSLVVFVTLGFASLKFLLYKDSTLVFLELVYHNICLLCQLQPSWLCSTRFQLNFCKSILLNWESGWIFHWDSWILSASIFLFRWDLVFVRFIHILVNTPFSKLPFCLIGIHPAITMLILPYSSFLVPLGFSRQLLSCSCKEHGPFGLPILRTVMVKKMMVMPLTLMLALMVMVI